jgi:hypothetical protein
MSLYTAAELIEVLDKLISRTRNNDLKWRWNEEDKNLYAETTNTGLQLKSRDGDGQHPFNLRIAAKLNSSELQAVLEGSEKAGGLEIDTGELDFGEFATDILLRIERLYWQAERSHSKVNEFLKLLASDLEDLEPF